MEAIGMVNRYACQKCGDALHTINLNSGVTPFMIGCRSCVNGTAHSLFYRLRAGEVTVTLAWYRPVPAEFQKLGVSEQQHVLEGGLLLGELCRVEPLPEPDHVPTWLADRDADRWLVYVAQAYRPDAEMLARVTRKLGGGADH